MDAQPETIDIDAVVGCTDGFRQGYIEGWAWRPNRPHDTVVVQLLVDGRLVAESTACLPRPDLSTAGIGHGQHAFAIPFVIEPDAPPVLHMTVRAKDGAVLPKGEFELATDEQTRAELAHRRSVAHLEKVFGPLTTATPPAPRYPALPPAPRLNFILYTARSGAVSGTLGMPEYSYFFVMRGFREVLRKLGVVHMVRDPAAEVNAIYDACLARGEACLFFSFAAPQNTTLGLRCPTIPVIAWEFSSIPTGGWPGDMREDWRLVLRQTGRAITISEFAASAVRARMGAHFPVISIPTPVWDRLGGLRARLAAREAPAPGGTVTLLLDGFAWDSRQSTLALTTRTPPFPQTPSRAAAAALPMRGALLALALASDADARAAEAAAAQRAEAEARRQAAQAAEQDAAAQAEAARLEAAAVPIDLPPPPKTLRRRLGMTVWFARQWYREVVRDILPRPAAKLLSTTGRVAVALRAPPVAEPALAIAVTTEVAADIQAPELPVETPPAPEPPASVAPPVARYLPAPDADPLPCPELATFWPDPYPAPAPPPAPLARVALDGIVFTTVLSPKDGRKNWQDIVTAFAAAFSDTPDATLVIKMIGTDPTYWWWEFMGIVKALPPYACRILVLNGYLDDRQYEALIAATHFVVNASLAEGQCLPLVEFMSGNRPAVAPCHTAMLDYITPENAVIVASAVEYCSWPHDPRNHLTTTRHRIEWPSLRDALRTAYGIARNDPARYAAMGAAAASAVRGYCADDVLGPRLAAFLGLDVRRAGWTPLAVVPAEAEMADMP